MKSSQVYWLIKERIKRDHRSTIAYQSAIRYGIAGVSAVLAILLLLMIVSAGILYAQLSTNLPSAEAIPTLLDPYEGVYLQPTRLMDRSGEIVLTSLENPGIERGYFFLDPLGGKFIAPRFVDVTVALLDPNFWEHPGFDFRNLTHPEPLTIPERLVDSLLLVQEERGLAHSLQMRLLAAQIVSTYGRRQVLEWYLNSADFGNLAYGIGSAASLYLNKPASELGYGESALLAAVIEAPALNPLDSPQAALDRQKDKLEQLLSLGVLDRQQYDLALDEVSGFGAIQKPPISQASGFTREVLDQLYHEFGRQKVQRGGLIVTTTLDFPLQEQLDCSLEIYLQRLQGVELSNLIHLNQCEVDKLLAYPVYPGGSLPSSLMAGALLLDLETGQVLAMREQAGSRLGEIKVLDKQPGSLLTPFVALSGFARGMGPASLVWDIPSNLPGGFSLEELGNDYLGPVRLRVALANNSIIPLIQMQQTIGARNIWRQAESFGFSGISRSANPEHLLLRGGTTSLLEVSQAYSVFANAGFQKGVESYSVNSLMPLMIRRVEDVNGRVLKDYENSMQIRSILSPELAYLINHILSDGIARRISLGYPNFLDIGLPSGAKLGQTIQQDQAWAVGYTRQRMVVAWMGLPVEEEFPLDARLAANYYHALIQYASRDLPVSDWEKPQGIASVEVCNPSGMLPGRACPNLVSEVFLEENVPRQVDDLYQTRQINRETGRLATVFTPLELIAEETFMVVPPIAQEWAVQANLPVPPRDYDTIQPPPKKSDANISQPDLYDYVRGKIEIKGTAAGNDFSSYQLQIGQGLNPETWVQVSQPVEEPVLDNLLGEWDTEGLEGLFAIRLVVLRRSQEAVVAVSQVTVDNTPPEAVILYPAAAQVIQQGAGGLVNLGADIREAFGVERVVWYLNGDLIGERSQPPYIISWKAKPGRYRLVVQAIDLAGNIGESDVVSFEVR